MLMLYVSLLWAILFVKYLVLSFHVIYEMDATCIKELLTLPDHSSSPPGSCYPILVFCVMFCRSLFVPLSFYFWPLYCLSFLLIKIAHLVFSNSSLINEPSNQTVENPLPTQWVIWHKDLRARHVVQTKTCI
jgi:hypothetical protein